MPNQNNQDQNQERDFRCFDCGFPFTPPSGIIQLLDDGNIDESDVLCPLCEQRQYIARLNAIYGSED